MGRRLEFIVLYRQDLIHLHILQSVIERDIYLNLNLILLRLLARLELRLIFLSLLFTGMKFNLIRWDFKRFTFSGHKIQIFYNLAVRF